MSELKTVRIKKTTPNEVFFYISPLSNPLLKKEVYLTNRLPEQTLPVDWALSIFIDDGLYTMFKKGLFTFDKVDELVAAAIEAGVYFDEVLDFKPAESGEVAKILEVLKQGNRAAIVKAINDYGHDKVGDVAIANANTLTTGVVSMLENLLHIQLIIDGADGYYEG